MSISINDENLLRTIKLKLCVDNKKQIEEIEEISVQNRNLIGNMLNINLQEISKLKSLKSLSLKFFEINDDVLNSINQLENLEKIEFYMCKFNTNTQLTNTIKNIVIYNCENFNISILENINNLKEIELTHSGMVDVAKLNKFNLLSYLKIRDCTVISLPIISNFEDLEMLYLNNVDLQYDFDISKMKKLKFISLSESRVNNKEEYIKKLQEQKNDIEIEFKEFDLPEE